jgi:hypothetical protein
MKYTCVKFRKDRDGTIVAFENCGCEAQVNTFRPCHTHRGDGHQAARLKAEARYHSIQNAVGPRSCAYTNNATPMRSGINPTR